MLCNSGICRILLAVKSLPALQASGSSAATGRTDHKNWTVHHQTVSQFTDTGTVFYWRIHVNSTIIHKHTVRVSQIYAYVHRYTQSGPNVYNPKLTSSLKSWWIMVNGVI